VTALARWTKGNAAAGDYQKRYCDDSDVHAPHFKVMIAREVPLWARQAIDRRQATGFTGWVLPYRLENVTRFLPSSTPGALCFNLYGSVTSWCASL
jgi:hypothetical protein